MQEKINLAAALKESLYWIDKENYENFKKKKNFQKWSECLNQDEWLTKLHYLRVAYKEKKITQQDFNQREKKLVIQWWLKFC